MREFAWLLGAVVGLTGVVVYMAHATGESQGGWLRSSESKCRSNTATGG
jgi:hypothetical protein